MPNYQNGKIYAIRSYQTDEIYIGSTTQKLCRRLSKHRSNKKTYEQKGKGSNITSYQILEFNDAYIELIELCPCSTKEELLNREGHFIRSMNCVNKQIAGGGTVEWSKNYRVKNKEKIAKKDKAYATKNKDKRKAYSKAYRETNKEKISAKDKIYKAENKETIKEKTIKYMKTEEAKIKARARNKTYREKNKARLSDQQKQKVKCSKCDLELRKDSISKHMKRKHRAPDKVGT
jgi:hypothetical protein